MKSDNPILFLTNGLILIVSFIALFGFLAPLMTVWKIVWEVAFLLAGICLARSISKINLFGLSIFYALNILLLLIVRLFVSISGTALAFYALALVLMALGLVVSVTNIGKKKSAATMLNDKTIEQVKKDVDDAFENIAASNVEVKKYYDRKSSNKAKEKAVKKKAKKKVKKKRQ